MVICLHGYISLLSYLQNSYSEREDKHRPHQACDSVISCDIQEIEISQERAQSKKMRWLYCQQWGHIKTWKCWKETKVPTKLSPQQVWGHPDSYVCFQQHGLMFTETQGGWKGRRFQKGIWKNMWLFQIQKLNLISHADLTCTQGAAECYLTLKSLWDWELTNGSIINHLVKGTWLVVFKTNT